MRQYPPLGILAMAVILCAVASPVRAESRIEKNLDLRPAGRFTLEAELGSVTVTGSNQPGARIVVTSDRTDLKSEMEFTFTSGPGWVEVTARKKEDGSWFHSVFAHFEIQVPAETSTEVHTGAGGITLSGLRGAADVKTSGGPINITGLTGNLEAHTSGGPIRIREITGDVIAMTSGGPIEIQGIEGSVRAHTSGGGIHIDRVSGYVEARTSGGSINANYSRGNRHGGFMETSGGSIEVSLDSASNLVVNASTSGGSVSSDLPVRVLGELSHGSMHGKIGSGGEELRLHTSGGSIHIRAI